MSFAPRFELLVRYHADARPRSTVESFLRMWLAEGRSPLFRLRARGHRAPFGFDALPSIRESALPDVEDVYLHLATRSPERAHIQLYFPAQIAVPFPVPPGFISIVVPDSLVLSNAKGFCPSDLSRMLLTLGTIQSAANGYADRQETIHALAGQRYGRGPLPEIYWLTLLQPPVSNVWGLIEAVAAPGGQRILATDPLVPPDQTSHIQRLVSLLGVGTAGRAQPSAGQA